MDKFKNLERICEGTYAVVYKAQNRITRQFVAMKIMRQFRGDEGISPTIIREISLLRELKHPNIVTLLDVTTVNNAFCLILEYLSLDLHQYIKSLPKNQLMHNEQICSYLFQMTSAILYCHRRSILHRDLKPQNLLIDASRRCIKVADFGLSRYFQVPIRAFTHEVVTLYYRAPEILMGSTHYACPVDIWAIGCIFSEMVTKQILFRGDSEIDQLFCMSKVLGTPNEDCWPGVASLPHFQDTFPNWASKRLVVRKGIRGSNETATDLMARILVYDPSKRLSAAQILEHSYFDGFK